MKAFALTLMALGLLASSAFAQTTQRVTEQRTQHRPGKMSPLALLLRPNVRKDLKLSAETSRKIDEAMESKKTGEGYRFMPGEIEEFEGKPMGMLTAGQKARVAQLILREEGCLALSEDKHAKAVGLTAKQRQDIDRIVSGYDFDLQKLYRNSEDRKAVMEGAKKLKTRANERIAKVLTPEQVKKWESLLGPPLKA